MVPLYGVVVIRPSESADGSRADNEHEAARGWSEAERWRGWVTE